MRIISQKRDIDIPYKQHLICYDSIRTALKGNVGKVMF